MKGHPCLRILQIKNGSPIGVSTKMDSAIETGLFRPQLDLSSTTPCPRTESRRKGTFPLCRVNTHRTKN
jgi:hypothetical protein